MQKLSSVTPRNTPTPRHSLPRRKGSIHSESTLIRGSRSFERYTSMQSEVTGVVIVACQEHSNVTHFREMALKCCCFSARVRHSLWHSFSLEYIDHKVRCQVCTRPWPTPLIKLEGSSSVDLAESAELLDGDDANNANKWI
eukprot:5201709-Amphidinium_carterae.2